MAGQIETIRSATTIIGRNGIGNGILPLIAVSLKFFAGRLMCWHRRIKLRFN